MRTAELRKVRRHQGNSVGRTPRRFAACRCDSRQKRLHPAWVEVFECFASTGVNAPASTFRSCVTAAHTAALQELHRTESPQPTGSGLRRDFFCASHQACSSGRIDIRWSTAHRVVTLSVLARRQCFLVGVSLAGRGWLGRRSTGRIPSGRDTARGSYRVDARVDAH